MARILLYEDHATVLKKHGYEKSTSKNNSTEYNRKSSGHSMVVYSNGSWAHFDKEGKNVNSISNKDNGVLLKDYLDKYHNG